MHPPRAQDDARRSGKAKDLDAQHMKPVDERRLSVVRVEEAIMDGVKEMSLAKHLARGGAIKALGPVAEAFRA